MGTFGLLNVYVAANHPGAFGADQLSALTALRPLGASTTVAAIFFSTGSTIFFYVFLRSHYIPRALAGLGVFASALYLAAWLAELVAPATPGLVNLVASVPILIAEVGTGLWLLITGIKVER